MTTSGITAKRRDSRAGRYYETPDGTFPSVTTILACLGKPALINWAANVERELALEAAADLYEDINPAAPKMSRPTFITTLQTRMGATKAHEKKKDAAADIGTQVHKLVEWTIRRELGHAQGPEPRVSPEAAYAFGEYTNWRSSMALVPLSVEQTVWHPEAGYAGTLDLLAADGGEIVVGDFKTSKSIYDDYELQVAAYGEALNAMGHGPVKRGFIVRFPKVVGDHFEVREVPDFKRLFSVFIKLRDVWQWQDDGRKKWLARQDAAA